MSGPAHAHDGARGLMMEAGSVLRSTRCGRDARPPRVRGAVCRSSPPHRNCRCTLEPVGGVMDSEAGSGAAARAVLTSARGSPRWASDSSISRPDKSGISMVSKSANASRRRISTVNRPHSTRGSGADALPEDGDPLLGAHFCSVATQTFL